jgi:hypothetical protein
MVGAAAADKDDEGPPIPPIMTPLFGSCWVDALLVMHSLQRIRVVKSLPLPYMVIFFLACTYAHTSFEKQKSKSDDRTRRHFQKLFPSLFVLQTRKSIGSMAAALRCVASLFCLAPFWLLLRKNHSSSAGQLLVNMASLVNFGDSACVYEGVVVRVYTMITNNDAVGKWTMFPTPE